MNPPRPRLPTTTSRASPDAAINASAAWPCRTAGLYEASSPRVLRTASASISRALLSNSEEPSQPAIAYGP